MTLTLTSDDLESHIVVNVSSTLTNTTIWFVDALCFIVDVWTDIFIGFIRRDDLTSGLNNPNSKQRQCVPAGGRSAVKLEKFPPVVCGYFSLGLFILNCEK